MPTVDTYWCNRGRCRTQPAVDNPGYSLLWRSGRGRLKELTRRHCGRCVSPGQCRRPGHGVDAAESLRRERAAPAATASPLLVAILRGLPSFADHARRRGCVPPRGGRLGVTTRSARCCRRASRAPAPSPSHQRTRHARTSGARRPRAASVQPSAVRRPGTSRAPRLRSAAGLLHDAGAWPGPDQAGSWKLGVEV
jgi:hypothetical protein